MAPAGETRRFPLRVVLSVTTGRLLADGGLAEVREFLDWMLDDDLMTHQLVWATDEARLWLFRWFPELMTVGEHDARLGDAIDVARRIGDKVGVDREIVRWLVEVASACGLHEEYDVPRMPAGEHGRRDLLDVIVEDPAG